jgi:hypothetical protein
VFHGEDRLLSPGRRIALLVVGLASRAAGGSGTGIIAQDGPPLPRAYQILRDALGGRGRVACWLDVRDDHVLGTALTALLTAEAETMQTASLNDRGDLN